MIKYTKPAPDGRMVATYDPHLHVVAQRALYDTPLTDPERARHADLLAQEIQRTIQDYLLTLEVRGQIVDTYS